MYLKSSLLAGVLLGTLVATFILYFVGINTFEELRAKVNAVDSVIFTLIAFYIWNAYKGRKVAG